MKNKKGFTLVELLGVIFILILLGLIVTPKVKNIISANRLKGYHEIERRLEEAAAKYVVNEHIDASISSIRITKENLIAKNYIKEIYDLEDDTTCDAFVLVSNLQKIAKFNAVLICSSYKTEINLIQLIVDWNGGYANQEFEVSYKLGDVVELIEPTWDGYTFDKWVVTAGNGAIEEGNKVVIGNETTEVKALWNPSTQLFVVDLNGGTTTQKIKRKLKTGEIFELTTPTKVGYDFIGWERTNGNGIVSGNTFTMGSLDTTIKAKWKPRTYTITLDPNGGTLSNTTVKIDYDSLYGNLPWAEKEGYIFSGW